MAWRVVLASGHCVPFLKSDINNLSRQNVKESTKHIKILTNDDSAILVCGSFECVRENYTHSSILLKVTACLKAEDDRTSGGWTNALIWSPPTVQTVNTRCKNNPRWSYKAAWGEKRGEKMMVYRKWNNLTDRKIHAFAHFRTPCLFKNSCCGWCALTHILKKEHSPFAWSFPVRLQKAPLPGFLSFDKMSPRSAL